ncbi:MAG: Maf family protein [Thermoplasmata archaeon]|nr:Maf family protein [Thermoplasmata archaeon]
MKGFGYILASASPRRIEMFKRMKPEGMIISSNIEENISSEDSPIRIAMQNALAKALDVAKNHVDAIVTGTDTIVTIDKAILGKPKDQKDAVRILKILSGRAHRVITGVAIVNIRFNIQLVDFEFSEVTFKELSSEQIERYVMEKQPLDKAGAYGIQEIGTEFVESLEGSYENVMGLPVYLLTEMLEKITKMVNQRKSIL